MKDRLVFLPLGGCGEIGMNLSLYGFGPPGLEKWLIADLGVTFGSLETPGIDVICPDPSFIVERRKDLLGIVLTHGHEDHIGAVPYLWPQLECPIYATPFTAALVRGKLADAGLLNEVELIEVPLSGQVKLGAFEIQLITLTHSILEPNALAIKTPLGTVMHTGDWKIDPDPLIGSATDEQALRKLGDDGVLAMVCDSTNVFVSGEAGSEATVRDNLRELLRGKSGRIAVSAFASNVARVETIAKIAADIDRHPVLVGRSMYRLVAAAKSAGYLADLPGLVGEEEAGFLPPENVLYICTGSQGEPRAALARMVDGSHPNVSLDRGDTVVFSSRVIPGNEKAIFALMNGFVAQGIEVISDVEEPIHVSGHPCRDELEKMYQWVRPETAIPVHGERRHLAEHAELAKSLQIPNAVVAPNGTMVSLAPGGARIVDEVPSGRVYVDGRTLIPADDGTVAARKRLSFAGHVVAVLVLDGAGSLATEPRIVAYGLPRGEDDLDDRLADDMEDALWGVMDALPRARRLVDDAVDEAARRALRGVMRNGWGKRPVISVEIIRLDV